MTNEDSPKDKEIAARVRRASRIIAIAFTLWFAVQWFGSALGLPVILLPIIDFLALLSMIWALIEAWGIYRLMKS